MLYVWFIVIATSQKLNRYLFYLTLHNAYLQLSIMSACCARVDSHSRNVEFSLTSIECLCQFRRGFLKTKAHWQSIVRFDLDYALCLSLLDYLFECFQWFFTNIWHNKFRLVWTSFGIATIDLVDLESASIQCFIFIWENLYLFDFQCWTY